LAPEISEGREHYLRRYTGFYDADALRGKRLLVYEHSAVGRDILAEILQQLGAEVVRAGRSNTFVPIDTENVDEEQLGIIQALAADAWQSYGPIDAVVSTDGDSDRPLLLSVQSADPCHVRFHGGDLVGMVVAQHLGANAIVVPITCNDAIDRGPLKDVLEPKTRIGSPFVIAGMEKARHKGRVAVCGWEANGGFLTGSDFVRRGKKLKALPTRDAVLPILGVLSESCAQNAAVSDLFDRLPRRFSRAALLKNFPRPASERILARFSPGNPAIKDVIFDQPDVVACDQNGQETTLPEAFSAFMQSIRRLAMQFFTEDLGFARILRINYIDGVRFYYSNGDVAHIRPSGNADELRIYAVADSQARADTIVRCAVAEPAGILRRL
jgi:phosphomannomutase